MNGIQEIPVLPVADPGPLEVFCGGVLNKLGPFRGAKVPDGVHVVVFSQHSGQVVPVPRQNVDHTSWKVRRVKNLQRKVGGCYFNAQSTVSIITGRNTINLINKSKSPHTVPDMLQSLFGKVLENMKYNEPGRQK